MPWVARDTGGVVRGLLRWRSEGLAEELLAEDDPEVIAFRQRRQPKTEAERVEDLVQNDPVLRRLVSVLADETGKTTREILDAMKAKA